MKSAFKAVARTFMAALFVLAFTAAITFAALAYAARHGLGGLE